MKKSSLISSLLIPILILTLTACIPTRTETPTLAQEPTASQISTSTPAPPQEPTVLISEVLTGEEGNNNYEFIELYNTGIQEPIDLKGWSLWYKLSDSDPEKLVYRWTEHTLIPPQGHYLLVREGQDVGTAGDISFGVSMIPQRGSIQLRVTNGSVLDSLAWGDTEAFSEGNPADVMKNGLSLERLPGDNQGNWIDSGDNSADFAFSSPNPQNVGSPPAPPHEEGLSISVEAPGSVAPGEEFAYLVSVTNNTDQTVHGVLVQLPLSLNLEVVQVSEEIEISDQARFWDLEHIGTSNQVILWDAGTLEAGDQATTSIKVRAPWTYTNILTTNYAVLAEDWPMPNFGSPVRVTVEGGAIPIGALKDLVGKDLVIEGTATMYTGGYFAGSGNVKFYLEDETGGVQVWVPDGEGEVNIRIGSRVRVSGNLTVYRGALELVANDFQEIEVLASPSENPAHPATPASIGDAANNPDFAGKLVQVEGIVARNEEFTYSYELDLVDDAGQLITLYIDKLTNINVETIESGQYYRAVGIVEIRDTFQQLYPRVQDDLERIYPPVLTLEMEAPTTAAAGESITIALRAVNYTPEPLTNMIITATLPHRGGVQLLSASDDGDVAGSKIIWNISELAGNGSAKMVEYFVNITAEDGFLSFDDYTATADEWSDPTSGDPYLVFIGESVPIWAIQGPGDRSPYVFSQVKTAGVVTGVFPELEGFWIQEARTDNDPATSSGLFVHTGELEIPVVAGNTILVSGIVRETYQQTQVQISTPDDIEVLGIDENFPASILLDPPKDENDSNIYYESLEGMLVQVEEEGVAVGPTSRYGEYVLVLAKHGIDRLWQGDISNNGLAIMVDDGTSAVHEDRADLPYVINTGDRVTNLIGPLAYTFGRYKIEPIVQPQVEAVDISMPSLPLLEEGTFSIMTWNVENLFDAFDPHPSSPDKPTIHDYKVSITKVAKTILAAGAPVIIGLQEVENIDILEDIAEHEVMKAFSYQPLLIEGTDSRYIDNGYLVRTDVARVLEVEQHNAPEGLTSRPPLQIQIEVQTNSGVQQVHVLNNHFTSMSGGEEATEPRRTAQAAWNATILKGILDEDPDARVAIIGDLNSFYHSPPIETLRDAGLVHVYEIKPEYGWYTYIYQGASQTLDHILVTSNLFDRLQRVDILHVNADYAPPLREDDSPLRKSDHDPVIATFSLSD